MNSSKNRADIVCVQCHSRKVRCDLQASEDGTCTHCRRASQQCIQRNGVRKRRRHHPPGPGNNRPSPQQQQSTADGVASIFGTIPSPSHDHAVRRDPDVDYNHGPAETTAPRKSMSCAYIAENSVLQTNDPPTHSTISNPAVPAAQHIRDIAQRLTESLFLPKPPLLAALTDLYFNNLYHVYPVIEGTDLPSSLLLQQVVCLAGSLMRRLDDPESLALSHAHYERTRNLINIRYDEDSISVLKAMCVLSCWSPNPSNTLSLDGPWHWTGAAIRFAMQLGLHRMATYSNQPSAGIYRRIWWALFIRDSLQSLCFGRPAMIRPRECDTELPTIDDFDSVDTQAKVFLQMAKLAIILNQIAEVNLQRRDLSDDEMTRLTQSLCEWIHNLPDSLRLFNDNGLRQPYHRAVNELHIIYFVTIILLEALHRQSAGIWPTLSTVIVAASCTARLFEEILVREHVQFLLPMNAFYCMVAAVPHLYHRPTSPVKEELRQEELQILRAVVEQMRLRFGGADTVLRNIRKLQSERASTMPAQSNEETIPSIRDSATRSKRPELFPFPISFCANLALLCDDNVEDPGLCAVPPFEDGNIQLFQFGEPQAFLDIFGLNTCTNVFDQLVGVESVSLPVMEDQDK